MTKIMAEFIKICNYKIEPDLFVKAIDEMTNDEHYSMEFDNFFIEKFDDNILRVIF